eukprot:CAMPEP_0185779884 /NCGR_PEP_ID=MMETSP1174-20130828/97289_1 /TAXON_ID=35687 /ORGANISM="Dictyocha speculum, Strain CCMP1381" /LENGTH=232 /DNA_ID=CAMNT_0028469187 /DNA_START=60 /DNA_END=754 /DNA_ORIENTATION=+
MIAEAFTNAEKSRQAGNAYYQAKPPRIAEAIKSYTDSIKLYEACDDEAEGVKQGKVKALNNRALCNYKRKEWEACEHDCNAAIAVDSSLPKAWGRRGYARYKRKVWKSAVDDFFKFQKLNGKLEPMMEKQLEEAKRNLDMEMGMQRDSMEKKTVPVAHKVDAARHQNHTGVEKEDVGPADKDGTKERRSVVKVKFTDDTPGKKRETPAGDASLPFHPSIQRVMQEQETFEKV